MSVFFIKKTKIMNLNQGESENMDGQITTTVIEAIIKKLPTNKTGWLHR